MFYKIKVVPGIGLNQYYETVEAPTSQDAEAIVSRRNPGCQIFVEKYWSSESSSSGQANSSDRSVSRLSGEVSNLSSEVANLRWELRNNEHKHEYERGKNEFTQRAHSDFREIWDIENEEAFEEGRKPVSYNEMKLMWGDPDDPYSLAMFERERVGGRVSIECPRCQAKLRVPDGRKGAVECPSCRENFYTNTIPSASPQMVKEFARLNAESARLEDSLRRDLYGSHAASKDSACFIATAAFGSTDNRSVVILRSWRDQVLLQHCIGKRACKLYEVISPPIAKRIKNSSMQRRLVRLFLRPIVGIASLMLHKERATHVIPS